MHSELVLALFGSPQVDFISMRFAQRSPLDELNVLEVESFMTKTQFQKHI